MMKEEITVRLKIKTGFYVFHSFLLFKQGKRPIQQSPLELDMSSYVLN